MPLSKFTHPPPVKPVVDGAVRNLQIIIYAMNCEAAAKRNNKPSPVSDRHRAAFAAVQLPILGNLTSLTLEKRWALYDSHSPEELLRHSLDGGFLAYSRGDVIEILEITNKDWALGRCRGRLGMFPLEQTVTGPFLLALDNYTARTDQELSFMKGAVVAGTSNHDPSLYNIFHEAWYGECSRYLFSELGRLPSMEERGNDSHKYYQYSKLRRNHIRLVYITPEDIEQFLASNRKSLFLTIHHAPFDQIRTAVALSYCWGDPANKMPVFANGKLLYIPSTLWRAIRRQYPQHGDDIYSLSDGAEDDPKGSAVFWADAICINQEDKPEKIHQIASMDRIYGQARQVLVYVNESVNSFHALVIMKLIAQVAEQYDPWTVVPHKVIRERLSRAEWHGVGEFISEQVFKRSWVIQEIVLATRIMIIYGLVRVKMEHILECIKAIRTNHVRHVDSMLGFPGWTREQSQNFRDSTKQLLNLANVKSRRRAGRVVNFLEVLQSFRQSKATDPRDKVYSLLSLASDEYRNVLIPDYSISNTTTSVYHNLARHAVNIGDLEPLLLNAGISANITGLPSWVPDWSYEPRNVIASDEFACCGSKNVPHAVISNTDPGKLTIRGVVFDNIATKSPRCDSRQNMHISDTFATLSVAIMMVHGLLSSGKKAVEALGGRYPNGADLLTAVWQTLVCGLGWNGKRVKLSDKNHFYTFLGCYQEQLRELRTNGGPLLQFSIGTELARSEAELNELTARDTMTKRFMNEEPPALTAEGEQRSRLEEEMYPFLAPMLYYQDERRTCITGKRYFGTVPGDTREGDLVVILFGLRVPFVIRSLVESTYQMVGPCYIYGIMDGEAFRTDNDEAGVYQIESVNFTLV